MDLPKSKPFVQLCPNVLVCITFQNTFTYRDQVVQGWITGLPCQRNHMETVRSSGEFSACFCHHSSVAESEPWECRDILFPHHFCHHCE